MKKIGIIGPESTGKTALACSLAEYFGCTWEPEYARSYVEQLQHPYNYEDVLAIANYQIQRENELTKTANGDFLFFDTELIITKIWFLHVYNKCPKEVEQHIRNFPMDYYLLCAPDLAWLPDSVRENGDKRDFFFDWYKNEIEKTGSSYSIVHGTGTDRFQCALKQIQVL